MKQDSTIKRYLRVLNRYRLLAAATFALTVGISGVVAFQPEPPVEYFSEGILVDNDPLVAFSKTSSQVQTRGLGIINEDLLLSDILLKEVSSKLRTRGIALTPDDIVVITRINIVSAGDPEMPETLSQKVTVRVSAQDPEVAETVLNVMFNAMVELSQVANQARLRAIKEELDNRLPQLENNIESDIRALNNLANSAQKARLEKQIALKKDVLDQMIASHVDAQLAEQEIVSSLTVANPPFTVKNETESPNPFLVLLAGITTALLIIGWLIFWLERASRGGGKKVNIQEKVNISRF
ncbi:MAG: hypothetical protein AAFV90_21100 [Cyanobacteria bacterium J06634_5]